jgi:hypothetical protein
MNGSTFTMLTEEHYVDVDQRVRIVGLKAKPELNGCLATVTQPRGGERVPIVVDGSGVEVSIRPTNLEHVGEAPLCSLRCCDAILLADRAEACCCQTIRDALELSGEDEAVPTVPLPLADAASVAAALRICRPHNRTPWQLGTTSSEQNEKALDATRFRLLRAATFLDCPPLINRVSENLAHEIRKVLLREIGPVEWDVNRDPRGEMHASCTSSTYLKAVWALRERFGIVVGTLSDSDIFGSRTEDAFTAPYRGKKRVPLGWPDDAIDEDQFETALLKLAPPLLRCVKGVSNGWRSAARRVFSSASYQATHWTLRALVARHKQSIGVRLAGVLARIDAHPEEAEEESKRYRKGFGSQVLAVILPVEWGLVEVFWRSVTLNDGRGQDFCSISNKAEGAALAAAILSRLPPPSKETPACKSWQLALGTAPLYGLDSFQTNTSADAAALAVRTLLRPADKDGYGRSTTGLAAALEGYMEATPPCKEGSHVRAAVVKELARWKKAEDGLGGAAGAAGGGATSSTADSASAAAATAATPSEGHLPAKGKRKRPA